MQNNKKQYFQKYYTRLMWEGILKSLLCGFIIGFFAEFVTALLFWMFDVKGFWVSILVGVAVGGIAAALFYFFRFQPTAKAIARRIDRLGLEERMITMTELENDQSFIALKQREDAKLKLNEVHSHAIKLVIPTFAIVAVSVSLSLGVSMTVVAGLSETGVLKPGSEIVDDFLPDPPVEYISVSYIVEEIGGGYIEGEAEQLVVKGEDATPVLAVPDDGWMFYMWSDGGNNPARTDYKVEETIEVWAIFLPLQEGEGDGSGEPGEGEPNPDDEPERSEDENEHDPSGDPQNQYGSGQYVDVNMIIDGKTPYQTMYDTYYAYAMELLAAGQEIPADLRNFIETYMNTIK